MTETEQPLKGANPFDPEVNDELKPEGYRLVRGLDLPIITRRTTYPFAELRLHDAIIFDSARELKNALQAARTYKRHSPKFKVSGRKIFRGAHAGKFAIIRIQ